MADWYLSHFQLDPKALPDWKTIDEMRLVANTVKHAEGKSAEELREIRPESFQHPDTKHMWLNDSSQVTLPVRMPLAGDDLYVTEELCFRYSQAANQFFMDVAAHFETHADHYFPG